MAARITSEDSDDEFQGIQVHKLQNNYRHAREDQREFTIEKKDQLRLQRFFFIFDGLSGENDLSFFCFLQ